MQALQAELDHFEKTLPARGFEDELRVNNDDGSLDGMGQVCWSAHAMVPKPL